MIIRWISVISLNARNRTTYIHKTMIDICDTIPMNVKYDDWYVIKLNQFCNYGVINFIYDFHFNNAPLQFFIPKDQSDDMIVIFWVLLMMGAWVIAMTSIYLRRPIWVLFLKAIVYCYLKFKLCYLINLKLLSVRLNTLFETKKMRRVFIPFF